MRLRLSEPVTFSSIARVARGEFRGWFLPLRLCESFASLRETLLTSEEFLAKTQRTRKDAKEDSKVDRRLSLEHDSRAGQVSVDARYRKKPAVVPQQRDVRAVLDLDALA